MENNPESKPESTQSKPPHPRSEQAPDTVHVVVHHIVVVCVNIVVIVVI